MSTWKLETWVLVGTLGCNGSGGAAMPDAPTRDNQDAAVHHDADVHVRPDALPPLPVKRVFATRTKFNGKFGGLTKGDLICNNAAQAAGLSGTWRAWLSSSTANAIDRIADIGPWYLVDNVTEVFSAKVALTQSPQVMIDTDEYGAQIPVSNPFLIEGAWTGTLQGGDWEGSTIDDCADWTAGVGRNGVIGSLTDPTIWTDSGARVTDCDNDQEHLYCFEQ